METRDEGVCSPRNSQEQEVKTQKMLLTTLNRDGEVNIADVNTLIDILLGKVLAT